MTRYIKILLLTAAFSLACSDRDHSNPFDPNNPSTQGEPISLHVVPNSSSATLYWSIPNLEDIEPGRIMTKNSGDSTITAILEGITGSGFTRHTSGDFGISRTYWLEVPVSGWDGVHSSDSSTVRLSPGECWVAFGYDHIAYVSGGASNYLPEITLGSYLVDLALAGARLWTIGSPSGFVYGLEVAGGIPMIRDQFYTGLQLASCAGATDGRLLLAHSDGLLWYDPFNYETTPWNVELPGSPRLIRLTPGTNDLWVWDSARSLSFIPAGESEPEGQWTFSTLFDLAPVRGAKSWVATDDGLVLADADADSLLRFDVVCSRLSAVGDSDVWGTVSSLSSVVYATQSGSSIHVHNVDQPTAISAGNALWVATRTGLLHKFSPVDQIAAELTLPEEPWAIQAGS